MNLFFQQAVDNCLLHLHNKPIALDLTQTFKQTKPIKPIPMGLFDILTKKYSLAQTTLNKNFNNAISIDPISGFIRVISYSYTRILAKHFELRIKPQFRMASSA